jgi:hypothetical protein
MNFLDTLNTFAENTLCILFSKINQILELLSIFYYRTTEHFVIKMFVDFFCTFIVSPVAF